MENNKEIKWLLTEKYNNKPTKNFYKDVKRLKRGEPLDYVIGFTEFLGCKIDLSKKPLIPRPETEFWTAIVLDQIKNFNLLTGGKDPKCLDIFSGSGCVGVAILANTQDCETKCDFADKEENALSQIKINLKKNFIKPSRYKIIKSDVFKNIKDKYDFIFANPPYIPTTRKNKIQKSVLKYEPKKALFGGKDGLAFIKKFLSQAKSHLNPGGKIYMEFDYIQKRDIEKMIKKYNYNDYEFHKDQYGKWRWVMIK